MSTRESVSVVIPTYNRAKLVLRAIESVLRATDRDDEIIVVDDGSTDDTREVVRPLLNRVRYIRLVNGGPGFARNAGIRAATHPLVAFLDSDDEWLADKLVIQRAVMAAHPEIVLTFSTFIVREDSGSETADGLAAYWLDHPQAWHEVLGAGRPLSSIMPLPEGRADCMVYSGDLYPALLDQMYVAASTAVVRRKLAGKAFAFPEDLRICEDWSCFSRVARQGPVCYVDAPTAVNHGHDGPRLTSEQGMYGLLASRIKMIQRIWARDKVFLAKHEGRVERVLAELYRRRARWLVSHGRPAEARRDLRMTRGSNWMLKVACMLPSGLTLLMGEIRQAVLDVLVNNL